jgi:hypothetical protein
MRRPPVFRRIGSNRVGTELVSGPLGYDKIGRNSVASRSDAWFLALRLAKGALALPADLVPGENDRPAAGAKR